MAFGTRPEVPHVPKSLVILYRLLSLNHVYISQDLINLFNKSTYPREILSQPEVTVPEVAASDHRQQETNGRISLFDWCIIIGLNSTTMRKVFVSLSFKSVHTGHQCVSLYNCSSAAVLPPWTLCSKSLIPSSSTGYMPNSSQLHPFPSPKMLPTARLRPSRACASCPRPTMPRANSSSSSPPTGPI